MKNANSVMISVKNKLFYHVFLSFLINLTLFCGILKAQNTIPSGLFRPPLDIPLSLSGTFCELRTNHFHSGLDFRTEGRQGVPVYAAASGYVVRIKVSAGGFGKVIYLNHPEGYTTVYAHLSAFNPELTAFIDSVQYANKSFEVELFPDSLKFCIGKGDFLGWSGNSGSSEAPHLHFEIRDQITEEPLNPLMAGFFLVDTIAPEIIELNLFTWQNDYWELQQKINYFSSDSDLFLLPGDTASLGFEALDPDQGNLLGIYSAKVFANDSLVFNYQYQRMNFSESRLVNAHIYFPAKKECNQSIERCFVLPGDSCMIFKNAGKGLILLNDSLPIRIKLEVADFAGNLNVRYLRIKKMKEYKIAIPEGTKVKYDKGMFIAEQKYNVNIPPGALYMDAWITSAIHAGSKLDLSPQIRIGSPLIPLQKSMTISFNNLSIPDSLKSKLLLAELDEKFLERPYQRKIKSTSIAKFFNNRVEGTTKNFGWYTIVADTIAPVFFNDTLLIDPVDSISFVAFDVRDDLSGIKFYAVEINKRWELAEWDPRIHLLLIPSSREKMGPDQVKITLTDYCGNTSITEFAY